MDLAVRIQGPLDRLAGAPLSPSQKAVPQHCGAGCGRRRGCRRCGRRRALPRPRQHPPSPEGLDLEVAETPHRETSAVMSTEMKRALGLSTSIIVLLVVLTGCGPFGSSSSTTVVQSPSPEPACDQSYSGTAVMLKWFSRLNTTQQGTSKQGYHASLKVDATTEPADANAVAKPCRLIVYLSKPDRGLLLKWTYHDDWLLDPSHKPNAAGQCPTWCNTRRKTDISGETELKNVNYIGEQDAAHPITAADKAAGLTFRGQVTISFMYRQRTNLSSTPLSSLKFTNFSFSVVGVSGLSYVVKNGVVMIYDAAAAAHGGQSFLPLEVAVSGLPGPNAPSTAFGPNQPFTPPIYNQVPGMDGEVQAALSR